MTTRKEREEYVKNIFESRRKYNARLVAALLNDVADVDSVMDEAATLFNEMIHDMAYVDEPHKPMALSLFACNILLAIYLPLRSRGIDAHQFGRKVVEGMKQIPDKLPDQASNDTNSIPPDFPRFIQCGEESRKHPKEGEFVFEAFLGDHNGNSSDKDFDWGMNITSCAICHSFSRHDAMELVPYMCATDDVMSDKAGQGLRRTGSIAVGASKCDFIYNSRGEASHIARLYPDKIQLTPRD